MLDEPNRQRRRRRTRDDVAERIREAARQLFAERGYAGATTKEIARRADVSETLLFRYFGGKARLFDEVVAAPFDRLMQAFVTAHRGPDHDPTREADARCFVGQVFDLFDHNREMFRALLAPPVAGADETVSAPAHGLDDFFAQSVAELKKNYAMAGREPAFDLDIAVRLGFGMIASGVLLRDWLFGPSPPSRGAVVEVLEQMVEQALGPGRSD